MNRSLIITLLLLSNRGSSSQELFRAYNPHDMSIIRYACDIEFTRVQEDCIYRFKKPKSFDEVLTPYEARLIRSLGCEHIGCRLTADEVLKSMGVKATRALVWGMRSKDAEISERSRILYDTLFFCENCQRKIFCPFCTDRPHVCSFCDGTGDIRCETRYDEGGRVLNVVKKDMFLRIMKREIK